MILAGDLGGTKTALALYDEGRITRDHLFRCADYDSASTRFTISFTA